MGGLETHELVRAVMMIEVRGNTASAVQKALQRLPEVTSLHRTCGVWDLVIELETTSLYEFDSILSRIRELPGVSNSETCPLLRPISLDGLARCFAASPLNDLCCFLCPALRI